MPIACGNTLLTGSNGSVAFKAPGTGGCLQDFSDFDAGTDTVQLPECTKLVAGDCVQFEPMNGATLDTAFDSGQCYCIESINEDNEASFEGVSSISGDGGDASIPGTINANPAITDAGSDLTNGSYNNVPLFYHSDNESHERGQYATADITVAGNVVTAIAIDNPGQHYAAGEILSVNVPGGESAVDPKFTISSVADGRGDSDGYIAMSLCDFMYVCNVKSFSLNLDREQLDSTSLMCECSAQGTGCFAPFKTYQGGYIDGTGTIEVMFTEDQSSISSRFITGSLLKDQTGAEVRLYINTVCDASGNIDENASIYLEAPITILGFSLNVSPDEITTATINFALSGQPTHFG